MFSWLTKWASLLMIINSIQTAFGLKTNETLEQHCSQYYIMLFPVTEWSVCKSEIHTLQELRKKVWAVTSLCVRSVHSEYSFILSLSLCVWNTLRGETVTHTAASGLICIHDFPEHSVWLNRVHCGSETMTHVEWMRF